MASDWPHATYTGADGSADPRETLKMEFHLAHIPSENRIQHGLVSLSTEYDRDDGGARPELSQTVYRFIERRYGISLADIVESDSYDLQDLVVEEGAPTSVYEGRTWDLSEEGYWPHVDWPSVGETIFVDYQEDPDEPSSRLEAEIADATPHRDDDGVRYWEITAETSRGDRIHLDTRRKGTEVTHEDTDGETRPLGDLIGLGVVEDDYPESDIPE